MPENMPTNCAQLTPAQVQLAFDYVLAVDAGDVAAVDRLAAEILPHTGLRVAIAEELVFPVTALPDDINADSFVLGELGVIFLMAIRAWTHNCPARAAPAIARCIVHFIAQVFVADPKDVARALEVIRDGRLELARRCTRRGRTGSRAPATPGTHPLSGSTRWRPLSGHDPTQYTMLAVDRRRVEVAHIGPRCGVPGVPGAACGRS